jgi:hypothetical protein
MECDWVKIRRKAMTQKNDAQGEGVRDTKTRMWRKNDLKEVMGGRGRKTECGEIVAEACPPEAWKRGLRRGRPWEGRRGGRRTRRGLATRGEPREGKGGASASGGGRWGRVDGG